MLIVGGTAALTAILAYLAWHFVSRWRRSLRLRRAERRAELGHAEHDVARADRARELVR